MAFIITPPTTIKIDKAQDNITIGKQLWSALNLADDIFKPTKEILPIIIESNNPEILQLPWELLYHPTYGFLARNANFTLSRTIPNLSHNPTPLEKRPLRVLFFSTLPDDIGEEGRLAVEHEQEVVLETIMPYRQEGFIDIKMPNDGRFESLKKLIVSYKPDMVFLSGHSGFSNGKGSFLFEDRRGLGVHIDEEELRDAFVGSSVECVVLSSCQSAQLDQKSIESGLVMSLASYGIGNVIGMSQSIYDDSGVTFATEFMRQVATKSSIAYAVQKGREEVAKLDAPFREHWHLPLLVSQDISRGLVDWDFEPTPPSHEKLNQKLNQILYPSNYIGRRKEFRAFYNYLYSHKLKKLLLYGEGGIGKTAMVAKFGLELREEGYRVFDYSLKHGDDFDAFLLDIELELSEANAKKFTLIKEKCHDESCVAKRLAKLLLSESPKIAFIFDNLESVQDPTTKEITDNKLKHWIEALSEIDGVVVLLTSRWLLPNCQHSIALNRPLKSDFLYFLSTQNINFSRKDKLDKIYQTFGGNYRGVEFFLSAIEQMSSQDEDSFLENIAKATDKMKIDMAIEKILSYLSQEERTLLERLSVYDVPVPKEGVENIALDMPKETVERLVSFSLVEKSYNPIYEVNEYQVSALVNHFLMEEGLTIDNEIFVLASEYLLHLFLDERRNFNQALIVNKSLHLSNQIDKANLFTLDFIVRLSSHVGLHRELVEYWLPEIIKSNNLKIKLKGLEEMGVQQVHLMQYTLALEFYDEALSLSQHLNDKQSEIVLLTKKSTIFEIQNDFEKAISLLNSSLKIALEIDNEYMQSATYSNIAKIYKIQNNINEALKYLKKSLFIELKLKNKKGEAVIKNNISQIYSIMGKFDIALNYVTESLSIYENIPDEKGCITSLNNISQIHRKMNNSEEELISLKLALIRSLKIADSQGICLAFFNIGHTYLDMKERDKVVYFFINAYNIAKKIGNIHVLEKLKQIEDFSTNTLDTFIKNTTKEGFQW